MLAAPAAAVNERLASNTALGSSTVTCAATWKVMPIPAPLAAHCPRRPSLRLKHSRPVSVSLWAVDMACGVLQPRVPEIRPTRCSRRRVLCYNAHSVAP